MRYTFTQLERWRKSRKRHRRGGALGRTVEQSYRFTSKVCLSLHVEVVREPEVAAG